MGVKWDLSGLKGLEKQARKQMREKFERVGREAVEYAKQNGNYHDRTGHLRASNTYHASETRLVIENTASYASKVESRGYDVISGAILDAMHKLEQ